MSNQEHPARKHKCKTCMFFYSPDGARGQGACVRFPPTPFIVGAAPVGGPLVDPNKPPQLAHVVQAYFPKVVETDGCWEHPDAQKELRELARRDLH